MFEIDGFHVKKKYVFQSNSYVTLVSCFTTQDGNHERDLVSFSFLVRNVASHEKRETVNSREK